MTWDRTKPTNTSKLRNLGTEIRPNWEAIEDGDSSFLPQAINLSDRTAAGIVPVTPVVIAKSVIGFSKQDSAGNPQAFTIDPDGIVCQLTPGKTPIAGANGEAFLPGPNLKPIGIKWGQINITSNPQTFKYSGVGGLGLTDFSTTTYSVQLTGMNTAGSLSNVYVSTWDEFGFTVVSSTSGANFSFIIMGE